MLEKEKNQIKMDKIEAYKKLILISKEQINILRGEFIDINESQIEDRVRALNYFETKLLKLQKS